jgi:Zn finger protein HypA/HybF involved in hydrogenase expression
VRKTIDLSQRRVTCEGCIWLVKSIRPQCRCETGPHYRKPRDTYFERCHEYAVTIADKTQIAEPRSRAGVVRR